MGGQRLLSTALCFLLALPGFLSYTLLNPGPLPNVKAAVIVPGFLTGGPEFKPLVDELQRRGIPCAAVPMPNWHWIPCLGGRSVRPLLERIDHTVRHVAAAAGEELPINLEEVIPDFEYSIFDCWKDFQDNPGGVLEVGGSAEVDQYDPTITPRGSFPAADLPKGRIALIGHSAGGWMARAYLSDRNYGGRSYSGSQFVHSLVTLGSPHGDAPGAAFRGVEWVNREGVPPSVRGLAVAGTGFKGNNSGQLTKNAYSFCCPDGSDGTGYEGDGVTPVFSALAWDGAEKLLLDGKVTHFPWSDVFGGDIFAPDLAKDHKEQGTPWYGSREALDQWLGWLDQEQPRDSEKEMDTLAGRFQRMFSSQ
eukprot:CAMPEP_0206399856 /NCGR_PEP_ID=MMETSP0294-20121207/25123_1 /ASSEMBLY_ACC=CAM_ASM_000327 /TAXON_ID=39354 /ORGANISM="Heterosigma akashiwo, Strain CCMP2393" /LENGTH=362 /DNA_ID=CAMNT_0053855845 /DNA_START=12 /DNA_END=1100 /DNA_ORIENTATION=-